MKWHRGRFAWKPAYGGGTEADFHGSRRGMEAVRGIGVEAVREGVRMDLAAPFFSGEAIN